MAGLILIAVVLFAGKKQKTFAMQESGNGRPPGFVPELINTEPGEFAGYRRSDMKMADVDTDISDVDETDLGLDENAFDEMDMLTEEQAGLSFREVVSYIRNGDLQGLLDYSLETIQQTLTGEIKSNNRMLLQLLAVVILGSVFTNLSGKFGKMVGWKRLLRHLSDVVSILLGMFAVVSDIAVSAVSDLTDLMITFIPAYTLAVSYTNGAGTAEFTYQITVLIIFLCEKVIVQIVFPLTKCSGVVGLVNKLNAEDHFSRTVTLLRNIAGWILKTMFAVVTGMNVIKGLIVPSVDKLERNAVLKAFGMLPGGNTVKNVSDILLGSGMILKNAIGIAGAVVVLLAVLLPVTKIAVIYLTLRIVSAFVQPLGDKRFSDGINIMAQTIGLMLRGIWCASFFIYHLPHTHDVACEVKSWLSTGTCITVFRNWWKGVLDVVRPG